MKIKETFAAVNNAINKKFIAQFGFHINYVTFTKIVDYMYTPKDSSSLAVTRILFGLAMLFDIPDERGGATMDSRWGDPKTCHFPLLPFVRAIPMPYMGIVYAAMWLGALGIMLGYKYRVSASLFMICYWYLLLIEKSYWNNHSYLFGLVALLLACTEANCYWSMDVYLNPAQKKSAVPYWNYFILKYQFFILYFMAGMKKGTAEWLTGYSVQNLSEHWVFEPFKLFLTVPQTDYIIVHWFVFIFDLTVAIWMMYAYTRHIAMIFCALFHLMNSRLFRIGMFPWVCLATMPLFYPFNWPKMVIKHYKYYFANIKADICKRILKIKKNTVCKGKLNDSDKNINTQEDNVDKNYQQSKENVENIQENATVILNKDGDTNSERDDKEINEDDENGKNGQKYRKLTIYLIIFHILCQAFLPYSHFITKGYNNWTNGLYGYSWDMMVHTWDINTVVVKIVDNDKNLEFYIDPHQYTPNERWTRHGDMVHQYAKCLKENIIKELTDRRKPADSGTMISINISVYIDVWCSMNGRFVQRVFDPKIDMIKANWSPFKSVSYLMPLLDDALHWRSRLNEIREDVHSWNNHSDVIFLADFPGYDQEKYIPPELENVTLTILEGIVVFEPEVRQHWIGQSYKLTSGNRIKVESGMFHKILNIGETPAYYMYSFFNSTEMNLSAPEDKEGGISKFPILTELYKRFRNMLIFGSLVTKNIFQTLFRLTKCQ